MKFRLKSIALDQTGITTSLACAIHCAALPLIATFLPLWGMEFLANPFIELTMLTLSLCIGLTSLSIAYKNHKQKLPISILILGFSTIAFGHFFEDFEAVLIPIGGFLIALAHLFNIKCIRSCKPHQHLKNDNE